MALRKPTNGKKSVPASRPAVSAATVSPVRNSAIPPKAVAKKAPPTQAQIAVRAFEISMGPTRGSEFENWIRAERELMGM
ncbi:MAG TPA: hypothetical protein VHY37_03015 [Tepidisphaeraceae bacterium]|jgi:hypothetical protein|nr:hypothetical protein [Tepidisphaeraceae bacterium]